MINYSCTTDYDLPLWCFYEGHLLWFMFLDKHLLPSLGPMKAMAIFIMKCFMKIEDSNNFLS